MTKLALVCVLAMICHYMQAQNYIKPLTVGDTVPDITFNNVINGNKKVVRLSDYKSNEQGALPVCLQRNAVYYPAQFAIDPIHYHHRLCPDRDGPER